jgi:hypothetical protein
MNDGNAAAWELLRACHLYFIVLCLNPQKRFTRLPPLSAGTTGIPRLHPRDILSVGGIEMARHTSRILAAIIAAGLLIPASAIAHHQDEVQAGNTAPNSGQSQNHPGNTMPAAPAASPAPANSPTPQESLAKLAGDYTRVIKFVGQGDVPSFTGTSKFSVVLGGKFLLEESSDTVFGHPVEGLRIYGYDDAAHQYQMARMYTMSTAITMMNGTSGDGGATINFTGETETSGAGAKPLHALLRRISDDQFVVTLSTVGADGKDSPFQETDYSRKK